VRRRSKIESNTLNPSLAAPARVNQGRVTLNANKLIVGSFAFLAANVALAGGVVPLGVPLGRTLGVALGAVLGIRLGSDLPIAEGALFVIAAVSLAVGIWIVRRKQSH